MNSKPHMAADALWAAYHGLKMNSRSDKELMTLVTLYQKSEYIAGATICEAARQAIALHQSIKDQDDYRSDSL